MEEAKSKVCLRSSTKQSNFFIYAGCLASALVGGAYILYQGLYETSSECINEAESVNDKHSLAKKLNLSSVLSTSISELSGDGDKSSLPYSKVSPYLTEIELDKLENRMKLLEITIQQEEQENNNLSKPLVCNVIGTIKELADFIFRKRNSEYIKERRSNLSRKEAHKTLCKDYFSIYTYPLNIAKKVVLKRLKLKKKQIKQSLANFCDEDLLYMYANYYSNLFGKQEQITRYISKSMSQKEFETIFQNYANQLLEKVMIIEQWNREVTQDFMSHEKEEEINTEYAVKLNEAKLESNDQLYSSFGLEEDDLKFTLFVKFRKNSSYMLNLLEKVNGVELISIGFS